MKNFLKAPVELPFTRYEVWELIFGVAFWFTVCIILNACSNSDPVFADSTSASSCEEADTLSTTADSVFTYIFLMRLEHPDIVMAQCIEESGNFSSPLFLHGHNCTGMRVPAQRPTLALGMLYNHARFRSWKDCIADYAVWQSIYARGLSKDDYFAYLDRVYAEKKGYSDRLKNIIKSRGL